MSERLSSDEILQLSFDEVPRSATASAFGVDYIRLNEPNDGRLYVTRYGWELIQHVLPKNWYYEKAYSEKGERLKKSTGSVYRVSTQRGQGQHERTLDVLVKFSRVAQDVPLFVSKEAEQDLPRNIQWDARFNSPFEEFGLVMDLRAKHPELPDGDFHTRTKRPLAVYSPGKDLALWRLGRHKGEFTIHQRRLEREGEQRSIKLDLRREYIMLYEWIKGDDAEGYYDEGLLTEADLYDLTERVTRHLRWKNFIVVDNKPRHYILRKRADGSLVRRNGKLEYALIDFELLQKI